MAVNADIAARAAPSELPAATDYPPALQCALLAADELPGVLSALPLGMARVAPACTHTTFAPTGVLA